MIAPRRPRPGPPIGFVVFAFLAGVAGVFTMVQTSTDRLVAGMILTSALACLAVLCEELRKARGR